jgi:CDP-paratose 2-epimerase
VKILITGICGFVGSTIARELLAHADFGSLQIAGVDNLSRPGSSLNRTALHKLGIHVSHGDIRLASDLELLSLADWVIDAAANPAVLAGVDGRASSRQLIEHNLVATLNLLEFCKGHKIGLIMLSTSRVYCIKKLLEVSMEVFNKAYQPAKGITWPRGFSEEGISEEFSTAAPTSLYGATKLASEQLALEYGSAFDFPVWINRCGVLSGAGQFGRTDQGIFSYWINAWSQRRPLKYIGFDGEGHQVRDCLHPRDLVPLLQKQMNVSKHEKDPIICLGGGRRNSMSLAMLSAWCEERFGKHIVMKDQTKRPFDVPWLVMDTARASANWNWTVQTSLAEVLEEIATHAEKNPDWLDVSA